jgi:hypothetical protein
MLSAAWADIPSDNAYIKTSAPTLSHNILGDSMEPITVKDMHIPVYGMNSNPIKIRNLSGPNCGTNHSFKRVSSFMVFSQR